MSGLQPSPNAGAPAAPAPAPIEALDAAAGLERMMGDRAMYLRVLARFRSDYATYAARLREALAAGDMPLAHRIIHTLKGAAAMIEARGLRMLSLDVEQLLRAGAPAGPQLLEQLEVELARVIVQVNAMLAPAPGSAAGGAALLTDGELARLAEMLDLGDSGAQDFVAEKRAGLYARLGAARMAELEAAVAAFDFERALSLLGAVRQAGQPSG